MRHVLTLDGGRGWLHYCPGCRQAHRIDTPPATFNGDEQFPTFSTKQRIEQYGQGGMLTRCCHYRIQRGRIEYLKETTHDLAGQAVLLPEI